MSNNSRKSSKWGIAEISVKIGISVKQVQHDNRFN